MRLKSTVFLLLLIPAANLFAQEDLLNPFGDPFVQLSSGLPGCPVPSEPVYSRAQFQSLAHERSQRGVSCWLAGRCRLPNAYLYDREIVPRVKLAINASGQFGDTSLWALGERRFVWLKGCVSSDEQARRLEQLVRGLDDVEGVYLELMTGTDGAAPYPIKR
ncbi:hypothetical protein SAMN05216344_101337 [Polaromonas sp. OV174]|uniref:BON domain-containing protein n=1 Tax=Polaromonas sp. OV174 TaxID=1855300 RepID=UPI0008E6FCB8|nr:BON domain-containing protein [Polaromonas sp. OV174]SFB70038.1 hypothetical protein SAMN05216344_101337 [Polaromonas sp. OV174]